MSFGGLSKWLEQPIISQLSKRSYSSDFDNQSKWKIFVFFLFENLFFYF
jgi:hypothetical protein